MAEEKTWSNVGKYRSQAALDRAINDYFAECDKNEVLYGEAGLALALDFTQEHMRNIYDGKANKPARESIQKAYLRIQNQIETDPRYRDKSMVSKSIFLLKQARLGGYQDKMEAKQDISVNVKMGKNMDEDDFR